MRRIIVTGRSKRYNSNAEMLNIGESVDEDKLLLLNGAFIYETAFTGFKMEKQHRPGMPVTKKQVVTGC